MDGAFPPNHGPVITELAPGPPNPDAGAVYLRDNHHADVIMLGQAPERGRKRTLSPEPSVSSAGETFLCPFPTCSRSSNRSGKGWQDASAMVQHVANTHVANGEVPGQSWLHLHRRWMCGHCLALLRVGRNCRGENCYPVKPQEAPSRWTHARCNTVVATHTPPLVGSLPGTPLSQAWGEMNSLNDIMQASAPLLRHIPKGSVYAWGLAFSHLLNTFVTALTWEALRDLLAFPKVTLAVPHRGGTRHKDEAAREVGLRITRFQQDGYQALWSIAKGRGAPKRIPKRLTPEQSVMRQKVQRMSNDKFLATLQGLIQDGALSKAVKHILSDGLHDTLDPQIQERLAALHPDRPPVSTIPAAQPWPWDVSPEGHRQRLHEIKSIICDFPAGSAAGPSGLRPQHLQDVVRAGSGVAASLMTSMDSFLQLCLDGRLPAAAAPFLCAANVIPLRKPEGGLAVRPVAVGETLRRLVGKFVARSAVSSKLVQTMLPHQCGIATPGACETIAMGLQSWVHAHHTEHAWAILQVDLRNAFNSVHREAIFDEIGQSAPELIPWVSTCYAQHSHLIAQGHRLSSRCGVQQGDPLGPLLFSMAWHRVVRKLPSSLHVNIWYLDDGHLVGNLDALDSALRIIATEGDHLGISINMSKCKLWGPAAANAEELVKYPTLAKIPQVSWAPKFGIRVLGLPVEHPSSVSFCESQMQAAVHGLEDACALLGHLGDPQIQHLLLRYCLDACRVMHFMRGIDCTPLQSLLQSASACVRSCLGDALGDRKLSELEWTQSTLPLRLGGLGIKDPLALLPAARLAASLCYLERGRLLCFPQDVLHVPDDWKAHVKSMHDTLGTNFEPITAWLPLESPTGIDTVHRSQRWWSSHLHKARARRLLDSLPLRDSCRFTLQQMPSTTAWMEVTPSKAMGTKFSGAEYRQLLRWWLGLPLFTGAATDCPCCRQTMDVYGDHLVSCKYNQPTQRHHAVRDALAQVLRDNGLACRVEVAIGGKRRPADVAIDGIDVRGPVAVDLLVHDPLGPSHARDCDTIKASLAAGEQAKVAAEEALCHSNGFLFSPMGWHPWAGTGPRGTALLRRLGKIIAGDSQGWARTRKLQAFRQRLSFALMQFVARQLQSALEASLNFSLPKLVAPRPTLGVLVPSVDKTEEEGLDTAEEEGVFVGPLRLRRRAT